MTVPGGGSRRTCGWLARSATRVSPLHLMLPLALLGCSPGMQQGIAVSIKAELAVDRAYLSIASHGNYLGEELTLSAEASPDGLVFELSGNADFASATIRVLIHNEPNLGATLEDLRYVFDMGPSPIGCVIKDVRGIIEISRLDWTEEASLALRFHLKGTVVDQMGEGWGDFEHSFDCRGAYLWLGSE